MANTQGQWAPTETVDEAEKSWAVMNPDLVTPQYGWRVGLCERPDPCMEWQA